MKRFIKKAWVYLYIRFRKLLGAIGLLTTFDRYWSTYYNERAGINKVANDFIKKVNKLSIDSNDSRIMVVGFFNAQKKATYKDLIMQLINRDGVNVLIAEDRTFFDKLKNKESHRYIYIPHFESAYTYLKKKYVLSDFDISNNEELLGSANQLVSRDLVDNEEDARFVISLYHDYYKMLFEHYKPDEIIIWNRFTPSHRVCEYLSREYGVKVLYSEFGILPGTYALEAEGQMGESYPATHADEFRNLEVSEEELNRAREIREYLANSGLNRNVQKSEGEVENLLKSLDRSKPLIVFAGNYDLESGFVPYNDNAKKYHTPSFASSMEAVEFLALLAKKNDWNFVYKPHPLMVKKAALGELPDNVYYLPQADLNELIDSSDLIITLTSQTAYISCIRKITTLTLGYNQLKEKGCTYEAYSRDVIEERIKEALEKGYTKEQDDNFIKHIAQVNKYYLYDGKKIDDKSIHYGKTADEFADFIIASYK